MRNILSIVHRWLGGLVGLGLALLGITGTALLWKPFWVSVPKTPRLPSPEEALAITEAAAALGARNVIMPSLDFGVAQASTGDGAGVYLAHDGAVLARWNSVWDRPETLLFDIHHFLLMGHEGEIITGWLGLAALVFVITGSILWWPTRHTFKLRPLPARLSRPAIIRHHRDIGVVLALPLLLSAGTGALIVLKPLQDVVLSPLSPAESMAAWQAPPLPVAEAPVSWPAVLESAATRFPTAELRIVIFPGSQEAPVQIRMRQPSEWHHNGRTALWMGGDGQIAKARNAPDAPLMMRVSNALYPLHAARMVGSDMALPLRVVLTLSGLGLSLLGSLAVFFFWQQRLPSRRPAAMVG